MKETIDVTKTVGKVLDNAGFGSDSNSETDISKAGVWDLCDALNRAENAKFSVDEAREEMKRRGI